MGGNSYKKLAKDQTYISFGRGLTFSWFAFTLFWFWADWKQIDTIFTVLSAVQWLGVWLAIWFCATATLALWEWFRAKLLSIETSDGPLLVGRYARTVYTTALSLFSLVVTLLLNQPAPVIVYKTF